MEFPDRERVVYERNPLVEVVCQVRFPRILALEERVPADFQLALGSNYPHVETREMFPVFPTDSQPLSKRVIYDFSTADSRYKVSIGSDFLSVSTAQYERWEHFVAHVEKALKSLEEVYAPPMFTRVGLRYQDVVIRRKLGLEDVPWTELIRNTALGLLAEDAIPDDDVVDAQAVTVIKLAAGKVACRYGLQYVPDMQETGFIIDTDFFCENETYGSHDALDLLRQYNVAAGRAFGWFINERLHAALGPQPVG